MKNETKKILSLKTRRYMQTYQCNFNKSQIDYLTKLGDSCCGEIHFSPQLIMEFLGIKAEWHWHSENSIKIYDGIKKAQFNGLDEMCFDDTYILINAIGMLYYSFEDNNLHTERWTHIEKHRFSLPFQAKQYDQLHNFASKAAYNLRYQIEEQ